MPTSLVLNFSFILSTFLKTILEIRICLCDSLVIIIELLNFEDAFQHRY